MEDHGTFSLQYRAAPVMAGGGLVVDGDGSDGNHNHIEYGVSEYQQVDGDQGKNTGCEPPSMTPSGIKGGQQQVKTSKSAAASLIGLCIPGEVFRSRERDFQMHVLESLSMEAAHEEYFSFASETCPAVVGSGHLDDGNIIGMNPDDLRRLAIDYEGSKALQGVILSRGKETRMMIMPSWRVNRAAEPLYDDDLVIDRIFDALSKDIVNVCLDMYGNYTVQCLLMEASPSVASQLGNVIVSNLLPFSLNFYGCRVVQCAMKHLSMEYREKMCDVLEPFALHCLQSQNANHVINALLRLPERDRPEHVVRIHASICHYAPILAKHKYGVTVLKTALESDIGTEASKEGTRSVLEALGELVHDEYGNYLVQNLIQGNLYGSRHAVHEFLLLYPLLPLACDKFGSNVFETLLLNSTAEESDAVILAFLEQCQAVGQTDEMVANVAMNSATAMPNLLLLGGDTRMLGKELQVRRNSNNKTAVFSSSSRCGYSRPAALSSISSVHRDRCVRHRRYRAQVYSDSYDEEEEQEGEAEKAGMTDSSSVDKEALDGAYENVFAAQEELKRENQKGESEFDTIIGQSREDVQRMVETSMLAAVAGLSYMFASLFKLEGYLSYVLPLPVVLSSVRSGPLYSLHCVSVVFLLLFILMGPVRGVTYMLVYGFLSVALGITFRLNVPWVLSVPLSAVVRLLGQWLYILVTSWVTRENLIELLVTNAQTLLDNMGAWMGSSGSTSFSGVAITLFSMLAVNAC
ncbi:hypothetical protein M9434_004828 [Picochlorum sp. BPE23]|nr:hypothetical protein M9434_004828 [Picochlorum sp. BPE23]